MNTDPDTQEFWDIMEAAENPSAANCAAVCLYARSKWDSIPAPSCTESILIAADEHQNRKNLALCATMPLSALERALLALAATGADISDCAQMIQDVRAHMGHVSIVTA